MGEYTLAQELVGEQQRLALMSALLDPVELAHIARLGVRYPSGCNTRRVLRFRRRPCPAAPFHACPEGPGAHGQRAEAWRRASFRRPDMLPCTVAEPDSMHRFWEGWLRWSVEAGIDYFVGRKIPVWLDSLGLEDLAGEGHTAQFNGGSDWATYWIETCGSWRPHC